MKLSEAKKLSKKDLKKLPEAELDKLLEELMSENDDEFDDSEIKF